MFPISILAYFCWINCNIAFPFFLSFDFLLNCKKKKKNEKNFNVLVLILFSLDVLVSAYSEFAHNAIIAFEDSPIQKRILNSNCIDTEIHVFRSPAKSGLLLLLFDPVDCKWIKILTLFDQCIRIHKMRKGILFPRMLFYYYYLIYFNLIS